VKVKAQKLDRHVVTELVIDDENVSFKLRPEPGVDVGFDIVVNRAKDRVKMTRVGPADDASTGAFDVHADDVKPILALAEKLRVSAAELKRGALVTATLDENPVEDLPRFAELVERLVAHIAPIVCEIADRSLTPNELVIRRALGNDRREEIFVPKATLREKYAALPKALSRVFVPLGLERADRVMSTPPAAASDEPAPMRAQLAPSQPPAAPSQPPPPRVVTARPSLSRPVPPPSAVNVGASRPPAISAPSMELTPDDLVSDPGEPPSVVAAAPSSGRNLDLPADGATPRNEALVSALKKIALLTRNGRTEEAYEEYSELYSSLPFSDYRPEEQRQALRLMVLPKTPPAQSATVVAAHQVAIVRLQALVAALKEPADYELLGVAYLFVGDRPAAATAFKAGLEGERARNAQSDLCGTLMRRLSET
jgi:hypothetical protein